MSDRIEKIVELNASVDRVWDAIADARQFGEWFRYVSISVGLSIPNLRCFAVEAVKLALHHQSPSQISALHLQWPSPVPEKYVAFPSAALQTLFPLPLKAGRKIPERPF